MSAFHLKPEAERVPHLCIVEGCRSKRRMSTHGTYCGVLCSRHRRRFQRRRNPLTESYNTLRMHARGRRIPFLLTLDEWRRFCTETGYLDRDGKSHGDSPSVDRRSHRGPYSYDNIQIMTVRENGLKGAAEREPRRLYVAGRRIPDWTPPPAEAHSMEIYERW